MSNYRSLESRAFSNFDDADSYDPDENVNNFDAPQIQRANFDLTFTNPSATNLTFELFSALDSFVQRQKSEYATGSFTFIPMESRQGIFVQDGASGPYGGKVGFNMNGDLEIAGNINNANQVATLKCGTFPYRSLLESSKTVPFRLVSIRMTTTTDAQIDNEIVHFSSSFLGGKSQNRISPRLSFRPEQFQSKIIDVPLGFVIDQEKGIQYTVNAGEIVRWNCLIEQYVKNTVR